MYTDIELVSKLLDPDSSLMVIHEHGYDRMASDTLEALKEILYVHEDVEYEHTTNKNMIADMEKHIKKLEKMLTSRKVRFKNWDEVEADNYSNW